ncbi:heterokaryon incompatibility protein-domain-containing protein [Trametes polyzona]|nr:heterokaryon incompatibility protein-domain-containing protein [Trametes polyzona]
MSPESVHQTLVWLRGSRHCFRLPVHVGKRHQVNVSRTTPAQDTAFTTVAPGSPTGHAELPCQCHLLLQFQSLQLVERGMYLLDTTTGQLELVDDPRKERYAILSHVWMPKGEQTFQDIQELHRGLVRQLTSLLRVGRKGPVSILPKASEKLRKCCEYARKRGFKKVWIDTCCIDKTSSSELSEAINSMYDWYASADVCFAYLFDVSDTENPRKRNSSFRKSRWFRRGWTLQELIAPRSLEFVSKEWQFIGTKASLAEVVEEITGIQRQILTHERSLDTVSVARRMSWASRRETKRPEDEAYSLMGIFGVKMPTIYGEGRAAFLRLQEEILKNIRDQSIFAWGSIFGVSSQGAALRWRFEYKDGFDPSILFARSPAEFHQSGNIEPIPLDLLEHRLGIHAKVPDYTITSYGVRSTFPSIVVNNSSTSALRLAVLGCHVQGSDAASRGKLIALLLTQQAGTSQQSERYIVGARGSQMPTWLFEDLEGRSYLPSDAVTHGTHTMTSTSHSSVSKSSSTRSPYTLSDDMLYRAVALPWSQNQKPVLFYIPSSDYETGSLQKAEWARLCIAHRSRFDSTVGDAWELYPTNGLVRSRGSGSSLVPMSYECPCEVIIPGWTIARLEQKGYPLWLLPRHRCRALALQVGFPTSPKIHTLALCSTSEVILIHLGPCPSFGESSAQQALQSTPRLALLSESMHTGTRSPPEAPRPALCVMVVFMPGPKVAIPSPREDESDLDDPHSETCWMEHVDSWEDGTNTFKRGATAVQLKFRACPGAWTHQQHQFLPPRRAPGRPMFILSIKVNPGSKRTGSASETTGTSIR